MKKNVNWILFSALLFIGILSIMGCKKEEPVVKKDGISPPAKENKNVGTENESALAEMRSSGSASTQKEDNPTPQFGETGVHWLTNYDEAKAKAVKEGKDLLLNFSGSDWCYWCIQLEKEVFSKDAFSKEAEKYFVFMLVDFPYDPSSQPSEIQKQNEWLARQYGFRGLFPTIYLATAQGKPYAIAEYKEGGPQAYIEYLLRIRQFKDL